MAAGAVRSYLLVTAGYWGFTLTDGAIRMLVLLYFHLLGYSPLAVASLFLFYEFFGVVTNLVGGWLAGRLGLNRTMVLGMGLQVVALLALTVPEAWLSVAWVMAAQALSGIAKDLNKMSAKASVKVVAAGLDGDRHSRLFRWVAWLTGSKNALKGAGFFLGAVLLAGLGFRGALLLLSGSLLLLLAALLVLLPRDLGKLAHKAPLRQVFATQPAINWLAAARCLLFAARDVWFVVALPVFLYDQLGWSFEQVGAFLALWVIGYGAVQAAAAGLIGTDHGGRSAWRWAWWLALVPAALAAWLQLLQPAGLALELGLVAGLAVFGLVFALNSTIHSYLVLAYSQGDRVAMDVGFYYMANAFGRLLGTLLSGAVYQAAGLEACLWVSAGLLVATALLSARLPEVVRAQEGGPGGGAGSKASGA